MLFLKKGGVGGAGGRAVGKARRMCHRAGKVQGYRREHCSRIREWRSQAKLCREPTMCVREGERKRVRAGGGARAGEGRVGVGRGGSGRGRDMGGGASTELPGGKDFAALGAPLHSRPPARRAPRLTRRAWTPLLVPLPTAHEKDRKDLLKNSQTIDPAQLQTPLFCSGRFSPSLSRFLSLKNLQVERFTGSTLWTPLELSPNQT